MTRNLARWCVIFLIVIGWRASAQRAPNGTVDIRPLVLEWSHAGTYILTGHVGGITLWDGSTGALLRRVVLYNPYSNNAPVIEAIAWSPDETRVAVRLSFPEVFHASAVRLVEVPTGRVLIDEIDYGYVSSLAWKPDGTLLAIAFARSLGDRAEVHLIDPTTGERLYTLPEPHYGDIYTMKWSPNGAYLAAEFNADGPDGVIFGAVIWDGGKGDVLHILPHEIHIRDFDWNPTSEYLVTSNADELLQFWDMETGERFNSYSITSTGDVDWSPDGSMLALKTAGLPYGVRLINPSTGQVLHELSQPTEYMQWKPDGTLVATITAATPLFFTRDGQTLPQFPVTLAFGIIDGQSSEPELLSDGQTVTLSQYATTDLSLRAYPNLEGIQHMEFVVNGEKIVDHETPFAIPLPPAGEYTLTATPFTEMNAESIEGSSLTIHFMVTGGP